MSNKSKIPEAPPPKRERVTITPQEGGSKVIQPDKKEEVMRDAKAS